MYTHITNYHNKKQDAGTLASSPKPDASEKNYRNRARVEITHCTKQ
jgi:hypothetical protein